MTCRSCILCCRVQNKWEKLEKCVTNLIQLIEQEQMFTKFHDRTYHLIEKDLILVPHNTPAHTPFRRIRTNTNAPRVRYSSTTLNEIKASIEKSTKPLIDIEGIRQPIRIKRLRSNFDSTEKTPNDYTKINRIKAISIKIRPTTKHTLSNEIREIDDHSVRLTEYEHHALSVFRDKNAHIEWN